MAINPEVQGTNNTQDQVTQHPKDINASKKLTVAQFVNQTATRIPSFSKIQNRSRTENLITLTQEQIDHGSDIRPYLQQKNYKKLLKIAETMTLLRQYDSLTKGLTREEVSYFLKILVDGQLKEIENHNQVKFIASTPEYKTMIQKSKENAYIISFLYLNLIKEGFKFTPHEYELFLTLESKNYRTQQAIELIHHMESNQIPSSLKFWNLKLSIVGDADPGNWNVTSPYYTLSKRGNHGGFERKTQFGNLLQDFSQQIGDMVPNLESHKLILLGSGKHNLLDLARHHINDFWGISPQGKSSELNAKVEPNSPLYPDIELLEALIATFGVNNQLFEAFHYITEFQRYYNMDLSHAHHFWKLFINWTEMTNSEEPEVAAEIFDSVWSLMESNNVTFNTVLYQKRARHLVALNKLDDLVSDMAIVQDQVKKAYAGLKLKREEKLLSILYQGCCTVVFNTNVEEEFDLKQLGERIALDDGHLKDLQDLYKKELEAAEASRDRFVQLQKEYDEEDDENSLW